MKIHYTIKSFNPFVIEVGDYVRGEKWIEPRKEGRPFARKVIKVDWPNITLAKGEGLFEEWEISITENDYIVKVPPGLPDMDYR